MPVWGIVVVSCITELINLNVFYYGSVNLRFILYWKQFLRNKVDKIENILLCGCAKWTLGWRVGPRIFSFHYKTHRELVVHMRLHYKSALKPRGSFWVKPTFKECAVNRFQMTIWYGGESVVLFKSGNCNHHPHPRPPPPPTPHPRPPPSPTPPIPSPTPAHPHPHPRPPLPPTHPPKKNRGQPTL